MSETDDRKFVNEIIWCTRKMKMLCRLMDEQQAHTYTIHNSEPFVILITSHRDMYQRMGRHDLDANLSSIEKYWETCVFALTSLVGKSSLTCNKFFRAQELQVSMRERRKSQWW